MAEKVKKGRGVIGKRAVAFLVALCVAVSLLVIPASAADTAFEITDTWQEIAQFVASGEYLTRYSVGDYKTIFTDAYGDIKMEIVAFDADTKADGSGAAAISWLSRDLIAQHAMNSTQINANGWAASELRTWLRSDVLSALPAEVQDAIVPVNKTYYDKTTNSTLTIEDSVWIPSMGEMFGNDYDTDGCVDSGAEYTSYFTGDASRIKKYDGSAAVWWLRSAGSIGNNGFRTVNSSGGSYNNIYANRLIGVALGFCTCATSQECSHTNTEVRNATDYYTGDTYCADCDELISSGSYAVNGWWVFKESVGTPLTAPLVENMAFTCCGRNFDSLGWTGSNVGIYYGNVKVYDNITGWTNDIYRTVNLGDALISVSKNFAAWFAVNATRYDHCPHFSAVELEAGSGRLYCYSCASIISSAGSCVHSNTYVKNQNTTYSGDTYCLDCGALISTGSALECPHSNTVVRDQTDYYTGDKYCADCGALLEKGVEDPDGALNSEEDKANSGGNSSVDDLTGAIPDYSGEFVAALTRFAAAFSYEGTDAVLTIPAITIPEIAGLIPETEIYAGQQFNFGDYFGLLPATLLLLVQALLTIALIVYCFKELYDMISYALTLRRGGSGGE